MNAAAQTAAPRALIAMSGGVDSSVAAWLMQRAGFHCLGATMRLHDSCPPAPGQAHSCGSLEDIEDARTVALSLGMTHEVLNFSADFDRRVVQKFVRCYEQGLTPNPCIDCNRFLKFGQLLARAEALGCDCVATGHYARVLFAPERGRWCLYRATDPSKDQSYVLYSLTQQQLAHIRFPLGELSKPQVRALAAQQGFVNARKRDSQDICFVPDGDYAAFIERYRGKSEPPGDFLNLQGEVVGRHRGSIRYTLGQRKGLGLAMGTPVYVCAKDPAANSVTVGPNSALFRRCLLAEEVNWIALERLEAPLRVEARVRYNQTAQPGTVYPTARGFRLVFDAPQRAITPGQAVVLYQGELVLGGGTICAVEESLAS